MKSQRERMKARGVVLTNLALGFVIAGLLSSILHKYLPTFGEFWQMIAVILVYSVAISFLKWRNQSDGEGGLKAWWTAFSWTFVMLLVCYAVVVGITLLFGNTIASASEPFLIALAISLPSSLYELYHPKETEDPAEDLYTRTMNHVEEPHQ